MTVFARSDVMSVTFSAESGGCGAVHSRPVTDGAPARVWKLSCPACETHLRHDPRWSGLESEIPETPDEKRVREDEEAKGRASADAKRDAVLEQLARQSGNTETVMAEFARWLMERDGKAPKSDNRPKQQPTPKPDEPAVEDEASADLAPEDLDALPLAELKKIAKRLSVKTTTSKTGQLELIKAHLAG